MDLRPRSDDADARRRTRQAVAETRATGDFFYAPVTPGLANRSVTVHSGALMALAVAVARPLLSSTGRGLRELSYHVLRPADGTTLQARAHVRRRGRRSVVLGADVLSHRGDIGLAVLRFAPAGG